MTKKDRDRETMAQFFEGLFQEEVEELIKNGGMPAMMREPARILQKSLWEAHIQVLKGWTEATEKYVEMLDERIDREERPEEPEKISLQSPDADG